MAVLVKVMVRKIYLVLFSFLSLTISNSALSEEVSNQGVYVSESSMVFAKYDSMTYVSTIGKLKNETDFEVSDIVLEVQYFDSSGNLIDAVIENLYFVDLPPHDEVAFRIQASASADKNIYASHKVRPIGLREESACSTNNPPKPAPKQNKWENMLISWSPLLIIMIVWIILAKKFSGRKSPQGRLVDLVEIQNELLERQSSAIEKIADAAERNKDKR